MTPGPEFRRATDAALGALPQAILFDLDDTIVDSSGTMDEVWRQICAEVAPAVPGLEAESLMAALAERRRWFFSDPDRHRRGRLDPRHALAELCSGALGRMGVDNPGLADDMSNRFAALRGRTVRPFDGALESLRRLSGQGIRLALVTNGTAKVQRGKIERLRLDRLFEYILIEEEFGVGKPDRRVYMHALDKLDTQPANAWMVGDNLEWEVKAPQRLGMAGIWVDTKGAGLPDDTHVRPDRIVRSIIEL